MGITSSLPPIKVDGNGSYTLGKYWRHLLLDVYLDIRIIIHYIITPLYYLMNGWVDRAFSRA